MTMNVPTVAQQQIAVQGGFDRHTFDDNLGMVLRKLNGLYIQRHFNALTMTQLDGTPAPNFEDIAHARITEIEQMLKKIEQAIAKPC
jgi:hypothetical protein